tara:strand:+ start:100 stop:738 length:639 start_codon:yes stop_codon:yes gene_type:complete
MIKHIIFDFDGVILDSVRVKTNAFFEMYNKYGTVIAHKVVDYHLKNGGESRFKKFRHFEENILNKKINDDDINILANEFKALVMEKVINCNFIDGAYEFLEKNFQNYTFYISTGTPKEEIEEILFKKNLGKFFKEVFGSPMLKVEHVEKIIGHRNLNRNEVIFIGDSKNDYEAANMTKIKFLGIGSNEFFKKNKIFYIHNLIHLENYLLKIS